MILPLDTLGRDGCDEWGPYCYGGGDGESELKDEGQSICGSRAGWIEIALVAMLSRVGLLSREGERQVLVLQLGVEADSDLLGRECTRVSHKSYLWQGHLAILHCWGRVDELNHCRCVRVGLLMPRLQNDDGLATLRLVVDRVDNKMRPMISNTSMRSPNPLWEAAVNMSDA